MLPIKNIKLLFNAILKKAIILIFILINTSSFSLGLGDIKVYSRLNEPLNAEIEINDVEDLDASSIIVELASPKDFMLIGMPRVNYLTKIKFQVKKFNEKLVIHLSTLQAVKNPFIDLLLQVIWPDGKIIKNYTILLDPQELQTEDNLSNKIPIKKDTVVKESISEELFINHPVESLSSETITGGSEGSENNMFPKDNNKNFDAISTEDEVHSYAVIKEESDPLLLNKVVSSLQTFSDQAKRQKTNYEKLFNHTTNNFVPLKEKDLSLKPSDAMNKINSELETQQNGNLTQNNQSDNNLHNSLNDNQVKFNSLDLLVKYGNDLLWSFCLVLMIIFLFHKMMISSYQPMQFAFNTDQASNLSYREDYNNELKDDIKPDGIINKDIDVSSDFFNKLNGLDIDNSSSNSKFTLTEIDPYIKESIEEPKLNNVPQTINEELELKISLAKQYLDVGDPQSAKGILQGINISKETFYKDQIVSLLKLIDC